MLTFTPEYDTVSSTEVRMTFNVKLQAREIGETDQQRAIVSLTSVLDKSGSMDGPKLNLVKRASNFMLGHLSTRDKLGVIEYDSFVNELIPLSQASGRFKTEAERMIGTIHAGSCTNLSGGLFKGIEQQISNEYVAWDQQDSPTSDNSSGQNDLTPAPTSPSLPPSDASYVDVDDTASIISIDSVTSVPTAVPRPAGFSAAMSGLFGKFVSRSTTSPSTPPTPRNLGPFTRARGYRSRSHPIKCLAFFGGQTPSAKSEVENDAVRSVFLFTDGQANEGVTDKTKLVSMVRKMVDGKHRVRVFTFGFGSDHDEELLRALAEAGSGRYYFIEKEDYIATAFADAMGGLLSVSAQNVKLSFVPAPGVAVEEIHTPFEISEDQEQSGARSVRVGDLMSEEAKDMLIDVRLPALTNAPEGESIDFKIGHLEVTYLDVNSASIMRLHLDCVVKRTRHVTAVAANRVVSVQRARIDTVRALEESRAHADGGRFEASRQLLHAHAQRLEGLIASAHGAQDATAAGMAEVLRNDVTKAIENTSSEHVWRCKGKKKLEMKVQSRRTQHATRCADSSDSEDEDDEFADGAEMDGVADEMEQRSRAFSKAARGVSSVSNFRSGSKMQQSMRFAAKSVR